MTTNQSSISLGSTTPTYYPTDYQEVPDATRVEVIQQHQLTEFANHLLTQPEHIEKPNGIVNDFTLGSLVPFISANTGLRSLNLSAATISAVAKLSLLKSLRNHTALSELNLLRCYSDALEGRSGLLFCPKSFLPPLTILNIQDTLLNVEEAQYLSLYLTTNSTLTMLNLKRNPIRNKGVCSIAQALTQNTTLRLLNLSYTESRSKGAVSLANALVVNTTLTAIDFSHNRSRSRGVISLATALANNSTLTSLNLNKNKIKDRGASKLGQMLTSNHSLTLLDLGENPRIGDSVLSIFKGLMTNTTLTSLRLCNTGISTRHVSNFSTLLATNSTLTYVDLCRAELNDSDENSIISSLVRNPTITEIDLEGGGMPTINIAEICERNAHNNKMWSFNLFAELLAWVNYDIAGIPKITKRAFISELNHDCYNPDDSLDWYNTDY